MPEIKHSFSQGRMNKDFDERLLPNGEYIDAMNIEVLTSEGSSLGTVQTIKGNTKLPIAGAVSLGVSQKCVAVVKDESNNRAFWFLTNETPHDPSAPTVNSDGIKTFRDSIWQVKLNSNSTNSITPVFIDMYLEQHPIASGGSYGGVTWTTSGLDTTKVTVQSGHSIEQGMWMFYTSGQGGFARKVQAVAGNLISFESDPITTSIITYYEHERLEFSWQYPNVNGYLNNNTQQLHQRVLRFDPSNTITGINILEDFLFWTDNFSEPKKINIQRCIDGTDNALTTTRVLLRDNFNNYVDYGRFKEEHVTVIKKHPLISPALKMSSQKRTGNLNCNTWKRFRPNDLFDGFTYLNINVIGSSGNPDYKVNDILFLKKGVVTRYNFDFKLKIIEIDGIRVRVKILFFSTDPSLLNVGHTYNILLLDASKSLFDNKFVRFATRWKYVDGEYSNYSPFSNAAFLPSSFAYDTLDAYNLGMVNSLKSLTIQDFVPVDIPSDVVEIDILYTESNSPIIYSVDTISPYDTLDNGLNVWNFPTASNSTKGKYIIESENIYGALPSNQILRNYDNVPRRALSQEIVGNRLVYGNYLQNYNLVVGLQDFGSLIKPKFKVYSSEKDLLGNEIISNPYVLPLNVTNGTTAQDWDWNDEVIVNQQTPVVGWSLVDYYNFWYIGGGFQNYENISGTVYPVTEFKKFWQNVTDFTIGQTYEVSFRINNYVQGQIQGPYLIAYDHTDANNKITFVNSKKPTKYKGDGYYTVKVVINEDVSGVSAGQNITWDDFPSTGKSFFFQARNYQSLGFIGEVSHFSVKEVFESNNESVKSDRDYQLGVVYSDEFGRQTPVLTDGSATFKIPKEESSLANCVISTLTNNYPTFASKFRYFIKDTASQFYNLAVDRGYQAEDNQVWISFPSSERNKITEETYLSLKKQHDTETPVKENEAVYKVIAIENEAPEYIKQDRVSIAKANGTGTTLGHLGGIFSIPDRRPVAGQTLLAINSAEWQDETGIDLSQRDFVNEKYLFQFYTDNFLSSWYEISNLQQTEVGNDDFYFITLLDNIDENDALYIINETGSNVTINGQTIVNGAFLPDVKVNFALESEKTNLAEFIGKFFVKIRNDEFVSKFLLAGSLSNNYIINSSTSAWYLSDFIADTGTMGVNGGVQNLKTYLGTSGTDSNGDPYYDLTGKYDCVQTDGGFSTGVAEVKTVAPQGLFASWSTSSGVIEWDNSLPVNYKWVIRGSEDAKYKWERLLKFTLFSTWGLGTAATRSEFFIDNVSYVGILGFGANGTDPATRPSNGRYVNQGVFSHGDSYDTLVLDPTHSLHTDELGASIPVVCGNGIYNTGGKANNARFGRGIFVADGTETDIDGVADNFFENGRTYMELGFSRISSTSNTTDIPAANVDNPANYENAWAVGKAVNEAHDEEKFFVDKLKVGSKFRFSKDPNNRVYIIRKIKTEKRFNHTQFPGRTWSGTGQNPYPWTNYAVVAGDGSNVLGFGANTYQKFTWSDLSTNFNSTTSNEIITNYKWNKPNKKIVNIDTDQYQGVSTGVGRIYLSGDVSWENEKTRFGLASNRRLTWIMEIEEEDATNPLINETAVFGHANGFDHNSSSLIEFLIEDNEEDQVLTSSSPAIFETVPQNSEGLDIYYAASDYYNIQEHGNEQRLPFYNCYSWGNGVESNRIKDDFNEIILDINPIASTTTQEPYKADRKKTGLIFSGVYNSTSSINNLNQFIAAEKITKELNPSYGSIQKLYTRNSDLLAFCEDKVIKILANKDALFNADGNPQLLAVNNVLGQAVPFSGEYGISTNPESFCAENYRVYFTDKQRGVVLRLSMDGITNISNYGMSDWFKDNLKIATGVSATYNSKKGLYNVHLKGSTNYTISYAEKAKGWTSFKSFFPDAGISVSNNYYTFQNLTGSNNSYVWLHDSNETRNTFYDLAPSNSNNAFSTLTFVFNEEPSIVKKFNTLSYEGSKSKVDASTNDGDWYNLTGVDGWFAEKITTDLQTGEVNEFIEKEGKWFNFIKGDLESYTSASDNNIDTSEFTVQGLGLITETSYQA